MTAQAQRNVLVSLNFADSSYSKIFLSELSRLRKFGKFVDITLTNAGVHIPCHKVVLSAASEYFYTMFESGLEESTCKVIEVQGTNAETLKVIVDYIYTSEIDITTANVQSLVEACDLFQLAGLKNACEEFMIQQIDPHNSIGFYQFGKLYHLGALQSQARGVMLSRFKEVVTSSEFKLLSAGELIEYISDDELNVTSEDPVFEAVTIWTDYDRPNRHLTFCEVLEHVRLPFCTGPYLCHVVGSCEYVQSPSCQALVEEAHSYYILVDRRHEMWTPRTTPRSKFNAQRSLVTVGGLTKADKENRYCWYLKEETSTWELLAQMPRPNWKFYSACAVPQGILINGGYHSDVKKDCWLFDTLEKKWKPQPTMAEARCKHKSVTHAGCVYVFGGEDDCDRPLRSVEMLDPTKRHWVRLRDMPKALSDPLVASQGRHIFVFGGIEYNDDTSLCTYLYNPVWDEWHRRADMPQPCRLGAVSVINDRIYVIGGYTKSCMCYNPGTDTWHVLAAPRAKHGNAPAVTWNGRILVGGGDIDTSETTSVVEEYDPQLDTWSYWKSPLKEELSCHYILNVDLHGI